MGTTYAIQWAHGQTDVGFATYEEALVAVGLALTHVVIGHDGDISHGGERTLFWTSEELAKDDDGSRAAGSIRVRHPIDES